MRHAVLLASLMVLCAGCSTSVPPPDEVTLRPAREGDKASFGSTAEKEIHVAARRVISLRDLDGEERQALELEFSLKRSNTTLWTRYSEFLDSVGNRSLTAAGCESIGSGYGSITHCDGKDRVTASRIEHGLPGALGASALWGRTLRPGTVEVTYVFLGRPVHVAYDAQPLPTLGRCLRLAIVNPTDLPDVDGQRYAPYTHIPLALEVCHDEPFPRSVTYPRPETITRTFFEAGWGPSATGPPSTGPWNTPSSPQARPPTSGLPPLDGPDPNEFPVTEAMDALKKNPSAANFLKTHSNAFLRYTSGQGGATRAAAVPLSVAATRVVIFEGTAGATLNVRLSKDCTLTACDVKVEDVTPGAEAPSAQDPARLLSVPYTDLHRAASEAFAGRRMISASLGTVTWDVDQPWHSTGTGYLYSFYALMDGIIGVPHMVRYDGRTGEPLYVSLPRSAALERAGLPSDWPR